MALAVRHYSLFAGEDGFDFLQASKTGKNQFNYSDRACQTFINTRKVSHSQQNHHHPPVYSLGQWLRLAAAVVHSPGTRHLHAASCNQELWCHHHPGVCVCV